MQILVAIVILVAALTGMSKLITFYDRRLMLFEYGPGGATCSNCGRECLGVRRRASVAAPWGDWKSECCAAALDRGSQGDQGRPTVTTSNESGKHQ